MALVSNPRRLLSVTGVNVFVGDVIRHVTLLPIQLDRIAQTYAERVARDARKTVPVDTGQLRDSITVDKLNQGVYIVGPEASYGHIIEFGSIRQAPRPYMLPALDRNTPRFEEAVRRVAGDF